MRAGVLHGGRRSRGVWWAAGTVLAGIIVVLAFDRTALRATWKALADLHWWWVVAGIGAEGASMLSAAIGHRRLLRAGGDRIGLRPVVAVAFAGTAIAASVPFAGAQVAAAYSFRQYHRRGIEYAVAGWALAIAWLLSTASFALVLAAGAASSGNLLAAGAGVVTSLVFLAPPVAVILALRYPGVRRLVTRWTESLIARTRRLTGHPKGDLAGTLAAAVDRMAELRLRPARCLQVFSCYLGNWAFDIACFACAIRAAGAPIPWQGFLLAYGAGVTVDSLGLTPGGLGVVETALTAALVACGLRAGTAVTAVLVYRLVSLWMLLAAGWVVMMFLSRVTGLAPGSDPAPPARAPTPVSATAQEPAAAGTAS
ncbi:MAG TPA: lysylphosphatidylglycerol synthase transmembrane domain-containing protein [Acidimicrobiia bacterium]|nr:lysylphosphatidylglycerol synthase transmembrane domain-containing protein [Acidimicrobiia bacterium]